MTHPIETGAPRKWLTLLAMTGSLCMILLDVTVVGVSLPAIQADLHLSDVQTQWVVNAYILAMASTVALGGRAADALGKVPSFVIGVLAFTGASVGCAVSTGVVGIVGWRAVQGVAGALMQPASASLVVGSFAPGERGKAMAVYAGIPMLFLAAGPPIGGALTQFAGWSWNFWINVPIAAIALALTAIARPVEVRRPRSGFDPVGTVLLLVGLPAFIYGLMEGHAQGWTNADVLAGLVIGVLLIPVFIRWELRHPTPLLNMRLLGDAGILVNAFILFAMQFSMNGL
ncbi:MAG: MFS transporter, partial [Phycisphaerales bacterium]